jgi:hypothetical protein
MMVTLGIDKEKFPAENAHSVRAIRKLQRRQSIGFAVSLLREFEPDPRSLAKGFRQVVLFS